MVQLSHPYMTTGKTIALTRPAFVGIVMSLLFNMLSRFVTAFVPRSKRLLISCSTYVKANPSVTAYDSESEGGTLRDSESPVDFYSQRSGCTYLFPLLPWFLQQKRTCTL